MTLEHLTRLPSVEMQRQAYMCNGTDGGSVKQVAHAIDRSVRHLATILVKSNMRN
jgi:hypothetical protein